MPLPGGKKSIGANVRELLRTGRPTKQAVAIAMDNYRRKKAKKNK